MLMIVLGSLATTVFAALVALSSETASELGLVYAAIVVCVWLALLRGTHPRRGPFDGR